MRKPTIFVSCGQRTDEEKQLGRSICELVDASGVFISFFAERQSDLNGLHENIMAALNRAVGFIAVMHPRGQVFLPGSGASSLTRASVWIEQEIAIAAFINRGRKVKMNSAVYRHTTVDREGMRDLLHLNPTSFDTHDEIVRDLKGRLEGWKPNESEDAEGKLWLEASRAYSANIKDRYELVPKFRNDGLRVKEYSCTVEVPGPLVAPFGALCYLAVSPNTKGYAAYRAPGPDQIRVALEHGSQTKFMLIEVSAAYLTDAERGELVKTPVMISAQIDDRLYKATYPVVELIPTLA